MQTKLPAHFDSLASSLVSIFGNSVKVIQTDRVSGGDINRAYALTLNNGEKVFMKANEKSREAFFTAEVAGLNAIAETNTIGTPEILCTGTDPGEENGYSFLLLKFIKSSKPKQDYWETLGHELAEMHKAEIKIKNESGLINSGFFQDNFIGARPQKNTPCENWITFFRDQRLLPQFKAADSYFTSHERELNTKLLDNLDKFLIEPKLPSLLHGDLWNGNVMCGPEGKGILIDPACYIGNAEVDLAMTELFGGFSPVFYKAYKEVYPLEPEYESRRDLYNLYQLLNHLNLFGRSYLGPVNSIVSEYTE
ncbi:MAG: fructosamine kinase family protein [Treponema sp.]|uniref:fructosamine kinase family protein n=1 Tax=Treponema sp. TaxID=166 RepID=UPI00298DA99D|nr:fructosamine kinase family protein [Treponema sp.]MBR5933493.1 fructosamine kinase family protein [Treponema sp.]